ncbi:hypothetical protein Mal64_13690 [Pseudobythopirellula maris]|uniref:Uncharacterized protein n=1 Tax=Pseudobythopirellula maris TaxID=2527991 RepID=A0A5C5ZUS0_9BACT|nr:hypothetical protein Mal64_13690 [Pseudobythopirellula maris]
MASVGNALRGVPALSTHLPLQGWAPPRLVWAGRQLTCRGRNAAEGVPYRESLRVGVRLGEWGFRLRVLPQVELQVEQSFARNQDH